MPTCPSCKREYTVPAKFCPECGAPQPGTASPEAGATVERETAPGPPSPSGPAPADSSRFLHGRFEPGTRLGTRYRVVGLLGRGGMGEVYRADDLELGQPVALKFLPEHVARNAVDVARLRSEVRTARQIAHPNVCRTYDIAESDGHLFVVMEYIDGEDLASVLRRLGRPTADKALEIARQLCLGLGAAHEAGVLHRDLKPANVMIDGRGRVRITDFGLAGTAEEIAAEGAISGTPAYMAPEQRRTGHASPQSDIFALGLVLYELFTGKRASEMMLPADPATPGSDSSVRTPSSLVGDIDPAVERVILRCLERDPARRPQSAYAVYGALPGGDPLAAAVAAGETPSPELVANAGVEGSLRPVIAASLAAATAIGLALLSFMCQPFFRGLDRSPQYLSVRAEEILTQAVGRPPRFSSDGFRYAPALKDSAARADSVARAARGQRMKPEPAKQYWRRWSPSLLVTAELHNPGSSIDDPPQAYPGSATLVLDPRGNLLSLLTVPEPTRDSTATRPVDWSGVLRATGRDPAALRPAPVPAGFLSSHADTVAAWSVADPVRSAAGSARAETTIVAAAHQGKILQVETYAGTTALGDLAVRSPFQEPTPLNWIQMLIYGMVPIVGGLLLAIRNLRSGRGDIRGALAVGGSIAVLYLLEFLFRVHLGELGPFYVLMWMLDEIPLGHALLHATIMAIAYLAIEPYARRLWPRVLVGWARLVSGRWTDPIVGRDILIGCAWGVAVQLLYVASQVAARSFAITDEPMKLTPWNLELMLAPQRVLFGASHDLAVAFLGATTFFTQAVILRFVLRSNRVALSGLVVLLTLVGVDYGQKTAWLSAGVGLVTAAFGVFLALRYGFVAAIMAFYASSLAGDLPWTSGLGTWLAPQTLLGWGIVAVLLVYGFLTATRGRSLFRDPLSDPVLGGARRAAP